MLLKTWFLRFYLLGNIDLDFILFIGFHNIKQSPEILNIKVEMLFEFQYTMNIYKLLDSN